MIKNTFTKKIANYALLIPLLHSLPSHTSPQNNSRSSDQTTQKAYNTSPYHRKQGKNIKSLLASPKKILLILTICGTILGVGSIYYARQRTKKKQTHSTTNN